VIDVQNGYLGRERNIRFDFKQEGELEIVLCLLDFEVLVKKPGVFLAQTFGFRIGHTVILHPKMGKY
jgi:hypothetical protein